MRKLFFTVTEEYNDKPLLHFIKTYVKLSMHTIQSIRNIKGAVLINEKCARMIDRVFEGDILEIQLPEKTTPPTLWDFPLTVIYEDEDLLVIDKPSGISAHPTYNHPDGTLANAVAAYLAKKDNNFSAARSVGRLDKVTSGVMIFAKNSFIASRLNNNTEKIYTALVYGHLDDIGTINAPIYRPDPNKTERAVGNGDEAVTHWKILKKLCDASLLEITTETGRTHQIRVHCAHIGHPLIGDMMYGGAETENLKRAALHCSSISIIHPVTEEGMTFTAPLPEDMKKELEKRKNLVDKQSIIC